MFAKIEIIGTIEIMSGLHIGTPNAFSAIGAIDAFTIRDVYTQLPMIPGSSLKGKVRSLLAKSHPNGIENRADDDVEEICRLFGSAKKGSAKNSRLIFSDMVMNNWDELKKKGLRSQTEVKFENYICRCSATAMPRQIERVVRGAEFPLQIIYNAEEEAEIIEDMKMLKEGITLLTYDYLGGSGSRGYGKVCFKDLNARLVAGKLEHTILEQCNEILNK